jgi:hypothetical protein
MSHPPNGVIFASSKRCCASSGENFTSDSLGARLFLVVVLQRWFRAKFNDVTIYFVANTRHRQYV